MKLRYGYRFIQERERDVWLSTIGASGINNQHRKKLYRMVVALRHRVSIYVYYRYRFKYGAHAICVWRESYSVSQPSKIDWNETERKTMLNFHSTRQNVSVCVIVDFIICMYAFYISKNFYSIGFDEPLHLHIDVKIHVNCMSCARSGLYFV